MAKTSLFAGVAATLEASMPESAIASFIYSFIKSVTVASSLNVIFIPRNR